MIDRRCQQTQIERERSERMRVEHLFENESKLVENYVHIHHTLIFKAAGCFFDAATFLLSDVSP